jgi:O-methyltransferase
LLTLQQRGMPKPPLDLPAEQAVHGDITETEFWDILPKVWDYTELSTAVLYNLYSAIRYIVSRGIEGDLVECGVHLGGAVMLMEHVLLRQAVADRRVFALDTFYGFVDRDEELDVDIASGEIACIPQTEESDFGDHAFENMASVGFRGLRVIKGDVLKTIPDTNFGKIALLRLDTDTYETTKFELEQLYGRVAVGGVIIIDDYGYTVGCKKAVDDFITEHPVFLQRVSRYCRSWIKIEVG